MPQKSYTVVTTVIREVARHQADSAPCIVELSDISGDYVFANKQCIYNEHLSLFVELSRAQVAHIKEGRPISVRGYALS